MEYVRVFHHPICPDHRCVDVVLKTSVSLTCTSRNVLGKGMYAICSQRVFDIIMITVCGRPQSGCMYAHIPTSAVSRGEPRRGTDLFERNNTCESVCTTREGVGAGGGLGKGQQRSEPGMAEKLKVFMGNINSTRTAASKSVLDDINHDLSASFHFLELQGGGGCITSSPVFAQKSAKKRRERERCGKSACVTPAALLPAFCPSSWMRLLLGNMNIVRDFAVPTKDGPGKA